MRAAAAIAAVLLWLAAVTSMGTAKPVGRGGRMQRVLQTPSDRLQTALYVGDASNVTVEELRAALDAIVDEAANVVTTVAAIPWGQPAQNLSLTWDPTHDSVQLDLVDTEHTAALFTTNYHYKNPSGSTKFILATAGYSVYGHGGRMAAFGANPLARIWAQNLNGSTDFDVAMINVVRWLLGEDGSATATAALTPRIVTVHLPDSFWCVAGG
jgi:hypothetical protein